MIRRAQPLPPPPLKAAYKIYAVYLGWTTNPIVETSVTLYAKRWFDLNGQESHTGGRHLL